MLLLRMGEIDALLSVLPDPAETAAEGLVEGPQQGDPKCHGAEAGVRLDDPAVRLAREGASHLEFQPARPGSLPLHHSHGLRDPRRESHVEKLRSFVPLIVTVIPAAGNVGADHRSGIKGQESEPDTDLPFGLGGIIDLVKPFAHGAALGK